MTTLPLTTPTADYDEARIQQYVDALTEEQAVLAIRSMQVAFDDPTRTSGEGFLRWLEKHPNVFIMLKSTRPECEKYDFNNFFLSDLMRHLFRRATYILLKRHEV